MDQSRVNSGQDQVHGSSTTPPPTGYGSKISGSFEICQVNLKDKGTALQEILLASASLIRDKLDVLTNYANSKIQERLSELEFR